MNFQSVTCQCTGCSNNCEVITILEGAEPVGHVEKSVILKVILLLAGAEPAVVGT